MDMLVGSKQQIAIAWSIHQTTDAQDDNKNVFFESKDNRAVFKEFVVAKVDLNSSAVHTIGKLSWLAATLSGLILIFS